MRIYGVVGWKNAGKTSLMERLVAEITSRGFAVSTLKHAHHAFDLDQPGKDSHRHRAAGAKEVLLASYKRWALLHELGADAEPPLPEMLAKLDPVDLVLVEGYKRDDHPKIEVFRAEAGHALIQPDDPTVRAVATDTAVGDLPVPVFDLNDTGAIADFILREVGLGVREGLNRVPGCFTFPEAQGLASVDEAQTMLRTALRPVTGRERVAVHEADGRILAEDAVALRDNPPSTNSAMDGFAFAHAGLPPSGEVSFELVAGRAAAGAPFGGRVGPGQAVRILTGALLPAGTDTVVMHEHVTRPAGRVAFSGDIAPGANTRLRGEDVAAGAVALAAGTALGPGEIGLLAAVGIGQVSVYRRLRVGVFSTGDELVEPGAAADPVRTYDANRPMLCALVARWGHEMVDLGQVRDDRDALRAALDRAATEVDVIVTSGGASASEEDHVSALMGGEGEVVQWRVALKPGKPLLLGNWRAVPVFGLPGNPVSAFVTALLFARPALSVLAGGAWLETQAFTVPAGFARRRRPGRREYLRARILADGSADVFRADSSGMVSGLGWAEGLVELHEDTDAIERGDPVRYFPFGGFAL